jgi:hypothetical protein
MKNLQGITKSVVFVFNYSFFFSFHSYLMLLLPHIGHLMVTQFIMSTREWIVWRMSGMVIIKNINYL